jgi:fructose-1,6-bisphosphatase/sedoheptulose 1,7-bisphosphatase-like protein
LPGENRLGRKGYLRKVRCSAGGAPEGILTAAELKALGGKIYLRMWPHTDQERQEPLKTFTEQEFQRIYSTNDLIMEESVVFCATGISDSQPLPEVKFVGNTSSTSTILMRARSQTMRYILAAIFSAPKPLICAASNATRTGSLSPSFPGRSRPLLLGSACD